MNKMHQLALDVKSLEKDLALCTRCGMCQAKCPLFKETRKEADVSRGKLALIQGLVDQMFEDAKGVNERLQRCLLCGSCSHNCPSKVNAVEIFLKARSIIGRFLGLPFAKKIMFKRILANPETFNNLMSITVPFQKILFKRDDNPQGTSCARIASPLLRNRHVIPLSNPPFNKILDGHDFRVKSKGVKVAFFVGCLIDKAYPNIAYSVLEVLNHFKADIFIPADQGCCGIPAIASGDMKTFEKLVETHVNLFLREEFDYLVTACATCSSTIIKLWPSLVDQNNKELLEKIERISAKTVDISWLLAKRFGLNNPQQKELLEQSEQLGQNDEGSKTCVTYHDPCHLKKSLSVSKEPRQVIRSAGYRLKEMQDSDTCCGMGGSFNLQHYELSSNIGSKKVDNIVNTGCSTIATSCPACMMQISDMLAKQDKQIKVKHPIELYAELLAKKK